MKKIKRWFYTGLIALLPIVITAYIFNWVFGLVLSLLNHSFITIATQEFLVKCFTKQQSDHYLELLVYVISLVIMIAGTCLVGLTLQIVFFARIMKRIKVLVIKIPLIKQVYTTISQITSIVVSDKQKTYQKAVMIEYPRKGIYSIGFLTSTDNYLLNSYLDENELKDEEKLYNIFIPTSPNPTSGMFVMLPAKDVKILDIKTDDAIKLIISGGVILPDKREMKKIDK